MRLTASIVYLGYVVPFVLMGFLRVVFIDVLKRRWFRVRGERVS